MTREQKLSLAAELTKQGKHVVILIPQMRWADSLRSELWGEGICFDKNWRSTDWPGKLEILCPAISEHVMWGRHPDAVFMDGAWLYPPRMLDLAGHFFIDAEIHYL